MRQQAKDQNSKFNRDQQSKGGIERAKTLVDIPEHVAKLDSHCLILVTGWGGIYVLIS